MNEQMEALEEKAEVRIVMDRGSLDALENAMELLKELKPKLPDITKEKVEEAIELMAQAKEKILPEVPTFKEVVDTLGDGRVNTLEEDAVTYVYTCSTVSSY